MAKADADGTRAGCAAREEGVSQSTAVGVLKDEGADNEDIVKELHEGQVMGKGLAPGLRVLDINHGRQDLLGLHITFGKGFAGDGDKAGLGSRGDTGSRAEVRRKVSSAVWPSSRKLVGNVALKVVTMG